MDCCSNIELNIENKNQIKDGEYYTCPMHPEIRQSKPGMCPECGMGLIPIKSKETDSSEHGCHSSHKEPNKHAGHRTESFLKKFWIAVILTLPIIIYSDLPDMLLHWSAPKFLGSEFVPLISGTVIFFYCGSIFLTSAYRELRARLPGMMTLIALAITTSYIWSTYATFMDPGHTLWWELSTLIAIMLLGHWIEMKSVQGAQGALRELAKLLPDTAEVVHGDKIVEIPLENIKVGDIVFVRPGTKIPTDGNIIEGRSSVNESIITGESKLLEKTVGQEVVAGSINGDGGLKVQVTKIGEDTFLAGVMRLVSEAQASKSRLQILSDRAAFWLTVIAIIAGAVTFFTWIFLGSSPAVAVEFLVAVLVITCPHALGLAIPLVASISTTMAANNGLLIKRRLALEVARNIDVVIFDKTGTLTEGEFGVTDIISIGGKTENDVIKLAASVNNYSEHPIGKAIVKAAKEKNIQIIKVAHFERIGGMGAKGVVDGTTIFVGNDLIVKDAGISFDETYLERISQLSGQGKTVIHVFNNKVLIGSIALADIIRQESKNAVASLQKIGLRVAMITGDSEDVASWVSKELGLDEYFAKVLPGQKAEKIRDLQNRGLRVAMAGDGINDAPALAQADLGIAVGAGTNVAIESAGIILVRNDPRDIVKIITLSRLTYIKMMQNLFWATGYNVIAIPIAAGVLVPWGIMLQPAMAAALMSISTIVVSINAVMLRRQKLL